MVVEKVARAASFATTFGGQSNLCVLPLVLFGTAEQKAAYLPRLIAGEIVGAYALSESGSGSDALAARTRAMKQADGSWSLTGEKMWISNGGFADLFIVFAKVDGEQFTAFLVERALPRRLHRQGRAQDGPARLVHHAGDPARTRGCRPGTSSARSAAATRWR